MPSPRLSLRSIAFGALLALGLLIVLAVFPLPAQQGGSAQPEVMTLGMWRVKPEQQEAFVSAWKRLGETFSRLPHPPTGKGTLLQSASDPTLFYSFGPWSSLTDIEAMRSNPEAQAGITALKALCTEAVPGAYRVVAKSP